MSGPWERYQETDQQDGPWTRYRHAAPEPIDADPTADMSFGDQVLAGVGKWMVDRGRGVGQRIGLRDGSDTAQQNALDAPLMDTPGGAFGNFAAPIAVTAPLAGAKALNTLRGAAGFGAGYGLTEPTENALQTLANVGLGGALGAVGQYGGQKLAGYVGKRIATRQANADGQQAANAVRDQTVRKAQDAGYVIPPASVNPSATNRAVESAAGKVATQQQAALRNQATTDRLVRQELGISENTPITREVLAEVRREAGQMYRQIETAGEIVPDANYLEGLSGIEQSLAKISTDFPELNLGSRPEIRELVDGLLVDRFSAAGALELTKTLRARASGLFRSASSGTGQPEARALAEATRDAANVVEEQIMRHLQSTGRGEVAGAFDAARRRIAIAHTVENAVQDSTGRVNAAKLAAELGRGRPLSGDLATAARTAEAFPSAMRLQRDSPASLVNLGMSGAGGAIGAVLGGAPGAMAGSVAWPLTRMAARGMALGPLQRNLIPGYQPNPLTTMMLRASQETAQRGGPLTAVTGVGLQSEVNR